jgi:murein DD-endopeptidase MepM/ murein hydrolase activator NlpD
MGLRMKQGLTVSVIFLLVTLTVNGDTRYSDQKTQDRDRVEKQHASDLERKQKILAELDAFMKEINAKLGDEIPGKMISPVSPEKMDALDEMNSKEFISPASGTRTSDYGYRVDPITKKSSSFHKGIDIAAPRGTPVKATASGVVKKSAYYNNGYGNLIVVQHAENLVSYYGHLDKRYAKKGDRVTRGDVIGTVGATGRATGPHLHFEIRKGEKTIDPDTLLR